MVTLQAAISILDSHVSLTQSSPGRAAEVNVPDSVIDLFEADIPAQVCRVGSEWDGNPVGSP